MPVVSPFANIYTYLLMPVCSLGAYRPSTKERHRFLSVAIFSISLLVYPISFVSFSVSLCQVFRGLPLRLFPGGFHVMAGRVMVFGGFLSVCPIHLHFLFFISFSMGSCLVIFQSVVLDILSVHFRCRILRTMHKSQPPSRHFHSFCQVPVCP